MLLPLGGAVSIPFIGLLLDHTDTLSTLQYCVFWLDSKFIHLELNRYSTSGSLFLIILQKFFGFDTFGTVYGLLSCICGIFNMSQNLLDKWTHTTFNMNHSQ
nr:BPK_HP1_G0043880.mRNA.1.CDS.1 [Saccharomyces cerevisiae]